MKLLLDENLSRRIVPFLQNEFPGSSYVSLVSLERAPDKAIWDYAKSNGLTIVTSDADFEEMSLLYGAPPHVVRLVGGNSSRAAILRLLIDNADAIRQSVEIEGKACVDLIKPND